MLKKGLLEVNGVKASVYLLMEGSVDKRPSQLMLVKLLEGLFAFMVVALELKKLHVGWYNGVFIQWKQDSNRIIIPKA